MEKNQYIFLWRENYADFLWTINTTAMSYFRINGILVYENFVLSAYASRSELKEGSIIGRKMFNANKYGEVYESFLVLKKEIKNSKEDFKKANLRKISNKELYSKYLYLFDLIRRFIDSYRLTEPYYLFYFEKDIENQLLKLEKNKKRREFIKAKLLSSKKRNNEIAQFLKTVSKERFSAKKIGIITSEMADAILHETARRLPLAISQISSLNNKELKNLLLEKKFPDINITNERKESFCILVKKKRNGRVVLKEYFGKEVNRITKKLNYKKVKKTKELRGSTAYPGKVCGNAVLVPALSSKKEYKEFAKNFKGNCILVAPMTSPELVPIFSKVKAIVTDEGGIASHAAIIAREMEIPCVVGTSFATKIIKNGMYVEVDATNAIVKIIKK